MGIKKIILLLITTSLLCASCSKEEKEPQISGYEGILTIHARYADGKYDEQISPMTIGIKIGDDLSELELPNKNSWDGHPGIVKGIFISKKEKTKVKASQLKNFDGTFTDLYVLYYYINLEENPKYSINEKKDFDGEYTNQKGDKINISGGVLTGYYRDITFVTTPLKRSYSHDYCFESATIIEGKKQTSSQDLLESSSSGLTYMFGKATIDDSGTEDFINDLTISCVFSSFYYSCVEEYYQERLSSLDFCFSKPNAFSIDYDL